MRKFLRVLWVVLNAVFGSWGYISRRADNFVAKYWDKKRMLLIIIFGAIVVLISDTLHFILLWQIWTGSNPVLRTLSVFNTIGAFLIVPFAIHAFRHASWHLTAHDDNFGDSPFNIDI